MTRRGQSLVDKKKDGLLRHQLDALANHIHQLPNLFPHTNSFSRADTAEEKGTVRSDGTKYFFLSITAMSLLGALSVITGMRSGYFARMRPDSALRFSVFPPSG